MTYTPKNIKRTFEKCINKISVNPKAFVNNPEKDFTRKRKLPFKQVVKSVLAMTGKSIRGELLDYFNLTPSMPTVSAFVQQRNKINHLAFETLFHTFTSNIDEQKLFYGYRLLAVDGSDIHTPTNKNEKDSFYEGTNGQKPYNLFHMNVLYDLQRRLYTDAIIQGRKRENEHQAFVTMVDRDTVSTPTIYIADRGYESYNNMAHVIEKGQKFLIRARDSQRNCLISSLYPPNQDEFDIQCCLGLTRQQTKAIKDSDLKFISHTSPFDYLPKTSKKSILMKPYYLSFRAVRFKLKEDTYEVLITNLTKDEFSVSELKELYAMRWGIETSFRDLKYSLALSYFHSKKTENILQEIFARLTMYNFAELITSHVIVKHKDRKYSYRINLAAAVHICRNFFLNNISPLVVEALLLQHLLPIRNGPTHLRKTTVRTVPSFIYRLP